MYAYVYGTSESDVNRLVASHCGRGERRGGFIGRVIIKFKSRVIRIIYVHIYSVCVCVCMYCVGCEQNANVYSER